MITDPRVEAYLDLLDPGNAPELEEIRRKAEESGVPVIRRTTEGLLKALLTALKPSEVLEVGTAVGYSAAVMSRCLTKNGRITTIEDWEPRIREAEQNFSRLHLTEKVTLLPGDAGTYLSGFPAERFDFIFLDAAKGQYLTWLPDLLRCLKAGGVLLSDNVLQEKKVVESRFAVERRERTIHARMREYLYVLTHTEGLVTSILPCGDGAAVTVKKGTE